MVSVMTPDRKTHLILSSLRQRAVREANQHYGGDDTAGIAGELNSLADELEAESPAVPGRSPDDDEEWLK
jgi:hypothetical protein